MLKYPILFVHFAQKIVLIFVHYEQCKLIRIVLKYKQGNIAMFPQGIYSMEGKVFVMIDFKKLVSSLNESYMKGTIIKLTNRNAVEKFFELVKNKVV